MLYCARRVSGVLLLGVSLFGCSGGGGSRPTAVQAALPATASHAKTPVSVRVVIPAAPATFGAKRRPMFVASTTQGIDAKVYASSDPGHTSLLGESQTDVSSGSAACGGTTGLPRTCTFTIPAPVGEDDFVITSYDVPPSNGTFPGSQLAAALVPDQAISGGGYNAVSITLGGVVASTYVALSVPYVTCPVSSSQQMAVVALDADGNVIASDGYVDTSGNPVSIALGSSPSSVYGQNVALSPSVVSAPSGSGVAVSYAVNEGFSTTLSATPSNGSTPGTAALSFVCPDVAEYAVPTASGEPYGIVAGPDGAMWFTEDGGNKIGRITTGGAVTNEFTVPTSGAEPNGIALGSDNNLWFTEFAEFGTAKIGTVTTGGTFHEYSSGLTSTAYPLGITPGPDGNLWFTEKNAAHVGRITTAGVITEFGGLSGSATGTDWIASDGTNLWFTEIGTNTIGEMNTSGTLLHEYSLASIPNSTSPGAIALGPDGALWFAEYGAAGSSIGRITTAGVISSFSTSSNIPNYIATGSDGALWFTIYRGQNLGRLTTGGALTYYPIPSGYNSGSPYSGSAGIARGPDGAVWFAEFSANNIGRLPL